MNYPYTKKVPQEYTLHGEVIQDDYIWLENAKSEDTLEWVAEQNRFTEDYFSGSLADQVEKAKQTMKSKPKLVTYSGITKTKDKTYAVRFNEGGEYGVVIVDDNFNLLEEVKIGGFKEINFYPDGIKISPNNERYAIISGMVPGNAKPAQCLVDLEKRKLLKQIDNIFFAYWFHSGDKLLLSQTIVDKENATNKNTIQIYDIAAETTADIYTYPGNSLFVPCRITPDDRYVFISAAVTYGKVEVYCYDIDTATVVEVTKGKDGLNYYIGSIGEYHYLQSNSGHENGVIYRFELGDICLTNDQIVISSEDKIMDSIFIGTAFIEDENVFVTYLEDAVSQIHIYDKNGKYLEKLDVGENCSTLTLAGKTQGTAAERFFATESFISPQNIVKLDVRTRKHTKCYKALDIDNSDLLVEQIFVSARDGVRVPAFVTRRKDTPLDGTAPVLMFGYGGYGLSAAPHFKNGIIGLEIPDWVREGNIYVSCSLRGGSEYGQKWHNAAKLLNKKNAFYDFIDITEWLIENKYTSKERIAILGCSNGGLLMSALTAMRPDLFRVVIDSVPHTDLLRFKNDATGPMYKTEYGDVEDREFFEYLKSYSPYHNIRQGEKYPAVFVQSGEKDNNVPPYHAKKFAAKLQECNSSENPILLRILANGAHNRGTGEDRYTTHAQFQIFMKQQLKILREVK